MRRRLALPLALLAAGCVVVPPGGIVVNQPGASPSARPSGIATLAPPGTEPSATAAPGTPPPAASPTPGGTAAPTTAPTGTPATAAPTPTPTPGATPTPLPTAVPTPAGLPAVAPLVTTVGRLPGDVDGGFYTYGLAVDAQRVLIHGGRRQKRVFKTTNLNPGGAYDLPYDYVPAKPIPAGRVWAACFDAGKAWFVLDAADDEDRTGATLTCEDGRSWPTTGAFHLAFARDGKAYGTTLDAKFQAEPVQYDLATGQVNRWTQAQIPADKTGAMFFEAGGKPFFSFMTTPIFSGSGFYGFDAAGQATLLAGGGQAETGAGADVDMTYMVNSTNDDRYVYLADGARHGIRRLDLVAPHLTVWLSGGEERAVVDGAGVAARFSDPLVIRRTTIAGKAKLIVLDKQYGSGIAGEDELKLRVVDLE